jgi:hypothetical protein
MRNPARYVFAASFLCAALALPAAVAAQGQAEQACAPDIKTFCPNVPAGGGRTAACLRQNAARLSLACRTAMAQMAEKLQAVNAGCEDDIHLFCSTTPPAQLGDCLKANRSNLSFECKHTLLREKG